MKRPVVISIAIALAFALICTAFGLLSPHIWNSPDETATAFFSRVLSERGYLWVFEPANLLGAGNVHPRSVISVDSNLVPASFYGAMIYFAALFKIAGYAAFSFGTSIATALASLTVFFFLRKAYGARVALFGQALFLANPALWYFTNRGLYPNVLFLDCVVIGLGILYMRPWKVFAKGRGSEFLERTIDDFLGLSFLGFAFLVRPVEFIWLAPILAVALWYSRRRLTWLRGALGLIVASGFAIIMALMNKELYGGYLSLGYTAGAVSPGVAPPAIGASSALPSFISSPRPFILPFGLHPRGALTNLWNYLVLFAWWLPALAAAGFVFTKEKKHRRRFGIAFLWVAGALGIYYGSGVFVDSSVSQWTIGSSYMRYFLPASVLLIPFAAEGLDKLYGYKRWAGTLALAAFVALSAWTVYFRSAESLVPMHATLERYRAVKEEVLKEVEPRDVIITERSDKIFFPDRRIMIGLREKSTLDELPRIVGGVKVYYYGITIDEKELPSLNAELHKRNLQLGRVKTFGNETLYSITEENN
jgi:hypothetical protein